MLVQEDFLAGRGQNCYVHSESGSTSHSLSSSLGIFAFFDHGIYGELPLLPSPKPLRLHLPYLAYKGI